MSTVGRNQYRVAQKVLWETVGTSPYDETKRLNAILWSVRVRGVNS